MSDVLKEQAEYYRARAAEYDEWFFRQGRYDRGEESNARWFAEIEEVRRALAEFRATGNVLELACGTGLWTERLVALATKVTCVDASTEMIELNRMRVGSYRVDYVHADLFGWSPKSKFDAIFFGFWLSHVPPDHFDRFWRTVLNGLAPVAASSS